MQWLKSVIGMVKNLMGRAGPASPEPMPLSFNAPTAPVSKRPPAKSVKKPAKKAASKTKPAVKRTPVKAPARTRTARPSGGCGK